MYRCLQIATYTTSREGDRESFSLRNGGRIYVNIKNMLEQIEKNSTTELIHTCEPGEKRE